MADTHKNVLDDENPAHTFLQISNQFRAANSEERAIMRTQEDLLHIWSPWITSNDKYKFLIPRNLQLSVHDPPGLNIQQWAEAAITLKAIRGVREDYRDDLLRICLIYHTALQGGADVTKLFTDASQISVGQMSDLFGGWLERTPENKSLYIMGYRKVPGYRSIAYEWIGNKNYRDFRPKKVDECGRIIVPSRIDRKKIPVQDMVFVEPTSPPIIIRRNSSWLVKMGKRIRSKMRRKP